MRTDIDPASSVGPSARSDGYPGKPTGKLRTVILSGVAWGVGAGAVVQVTRIVFAVALARLLTPEEYGVANMALVVSALVSTLTDLSLGVGLVQRPTVTEEDRSTVFWTNTIIGASLTFAGVLLAGPIAAFYGEPEVRPLFQALAASFLLGSLGSTHAALLHREMRFRAINVRVGASAILGGGVGVVFAAAGYGAWALILQQLAIATISTVLLWLSIGWRPHLVYSARSLRDLGAFGASVFGTRLTDHVRVNAERLLVGRFLGSAPLGTYSVAFNVLLSPVGRFLVAIMDTLFPALSRLQDDRERMASVWLRVNRSFAAAFVPALLGLAVVAPDFAVVVLGEKWEGIVPVLQVLSVGVLAQVLSALGAEVLKAVGAARALLRFSIAEAALFVLGTVVGLQWGIFGVAAGYALVSIPTRGYFLWLTARSLQVPMARVIASLSGVVQASFVLLGTTLTVREALLRTESAPWLRLVVVVCVGASVYVMVCLWRVPELREELRGAIRSSTIRFNAFFSR